MSPSWAQKPEEPAEPVEQKVFVVETSDEVATPSIETRSEPIKTEIELVVADENQKTAIKADSLDHAKKLLQERIEILAKEKEKGGSEAAAPRSRHSSKCLPTSRRPRPRPSRRKSWPDGRKAKESKEQTRIYLRKLGDEAKASPEARAKFEKAKARLEKIRAELNSKQKELKDAEHDLAKLSEPTSPRVNFSFTEPKVVGVHGKPLTIEKRIVSRLDKVPPGTDVTIGRWHRHARQQGPRATHGAGEEAGRAARAGRDAEEAGPRREA